MSRRSFPRVAAAGVLAVAGLIILPLPTQAQSPNPWRGETRAVAPAPRPATGTDVDLDFNSAFEQGPRVTFRTAVPTCPSGACAPAAVVVAAPTTVTRSSLVATPITRPTGNWCRELPGMIVGLSFRGDEVRITLDHNIGGTTACMTLVADCAVTRDGTAHGVITGTDIRHGGNPGPAQHEIGEVSQMLHGLVDQPFAFRCRMSDGTLMVSNWRIACPNDECREFGVQLGMIAGIFQPVSGAMPQPKPAGDEWKPVPAGGVSVAQPVELASPGVTVNLSPAPVPPQSCPVPAPPVMRAAPPPPPEVRGMMVETFHQMMNQMQPPFCAPPPYNPAAWTAGPPLLPPPVPTGVYMVPPMLPPPPPPPPMPAATRGGKIPVGTWTREMGPIQYSMTLKDGYLDLTLTLSAEEGGKTVTVHHSLTADCYLTRSGDELVGVLTGMDISVDGKAIEESELNSLAKDLPKLQQEIAEKPFAMTFRVYDDMLVIGNVRLPSVNESTAMREIFGMIAGRYRRSNGTAPRPVPMRVTRATGICDGPQCAPASARPVVSAPPAVRIQPVEFEPVYGGVQSHPPVPPMPAPAALPQYVPPAQE